MNIFKRIYNYIFENSEEAKIEKFLNNTCKRCNGIGIVDHENAEFRTVKHWCECKVVENGRPPGGSWAFDIRWKHCHKSIVVSYPEYDLVEKASKLLPRPELTFEPHIKLFIHEENKIIRIITYDKKFGYKDYHNLVETSETKKTLFWDCYENRSFLYDEEIEEFRSELRDKKLKELGI